MANKKDTVAILKLVAKILDEDQGIEKLRNVLAKTTTIPPPKKKRGRPAKLVAPNEKSSKKSQKQWIAPVIGDTNPLVVGDINPSVIAETNQETPNIASKYITSSKQDVNIKGKRAKSEPIKMGFRPNTFYDDGIAFANESVKVNPKLGGTSARNIQIREKFEKTMVTVECPSCHQTKQEDARFVNSVSNGQVFMRCESCIKG